MMVWIGQRDDAVVNLMMGWNGHRDHAVGDGLEWADRLSVLALPAARSWETKRIPEEFTDCCLLFHTEKYWAGSQLLTEV